MPGYGRRSDHKCLQQLSARGLYVLLCALWPLQSCLVRRLPAHYRLLQSEIKKEVIVMNRTHYWYKSGKGTAPQLVFVYNDDGDHYRIWQKLRKKRGRIARAEGLDNEQRSHAIPIDLIACEQK